MVAGDLETLKDHYKEQFDRKGTLENKANNMTSVSGVVAALLFGFGQFLIEKLTALSYEGLSYIIGILLIGILASLTSIILSVLGYRVQDYFYVIGHTSVGQPSLRKELLDGTLQCEANVDHENDQINAYKDCIEKNSNLNNKKGRIVEASMWTFVASIVFITILFGWLLVHPIEFPP